MVSQNTASGTNHAAASIASGFDYVVGTKQTNSTPTYTGYTKGNFDEVALWDTALSADEITAIYNSGSTFDLQSDNGNYPHPQTYSTTTGSRTTSPTQWVMEAMQRTHQEASRSTALLQPLDHV